MDRNKRRERWQKAFKPNLLAAAGLGASLILILSPFLFIRIAIFTLAGVAAWLSGRKLSPFMTFFVMAGIVGANLLVPVGRILWQWASITITETALLNGIERAITFEALVLISKATLNPALKLPGKAGAFLTDSLVFYEYLLSCKPKIRLKTFIADIDALLNSVYNEEIIPEKHPEGSDS